MRDDFPAAVKETLAKRTGFRCSNPACRHATSGPQQDLGGTVNIGVAAHIAAASEGGPRYDPSMTSEQRSSLGNAIWLCQSCGKLIDSDEALYDTEILHMWKTLAEATASREIASGHPPKTDLEMFAKLERLMPDLLAEMRDDLRDCPTNREFVLLGSRWVYNSGGKPFVSYYFENHADLENKMHVLENLGLIRDIAFNDVKRYVMSEKLADYLLV
ncbi:MAG: hypothetical protein ACYC5O_20545 [Anaerolineae bacterium]